MIDGDFDGVFSSIGYIGISGFALWILFVSVNMVLMKELPASGDG